MTTLKDIADIVGVSPSTVSKVINYDKFMSVSDETRRKIFETVEALEYVLFRHRRKNRNLYTIFLIRIT